ncbi:MAG: hypothetical protein JW751_20860 [Polyangiaceae bacterium]|nr:hypothetical protein [Polyangiaceae bacterium]
MAKWCSALLLLASIACDTGRAATLPIAGPSLELVGTSPTPGAGTECTPQSPDDCGVPVDSPIVLRFDRFLLPSTAVRQSVEVRTGNNGVFLSPEYSPIERAVVYRVPDGANWLGGTRYSVRLLQPTADPGWGFRAFDGASLTDSGPAPTSFTFRTRRDAEAAPPPTPPPAFAAMMGAIERGGCANAGCHRSPDPSTCRRAGSAAGDAECAAPRMGLDLGDAEGFALTAIGSVAHQTDIGPDAMEADVAGKPLGIAMPIIARANPGSSYLVYKLLVNDRWPPGEDPCETRYSAPVGEDCAASYLEDAERLRARFVPGSPMPLGEEGRGRRLSHADLRLVVDWIAAGASIE